MYYENILQLGKLKTTVRREQWNGKKACKILRHGF